EQGTFVLFKAQIDDNDETDDVNFFICDSSGRSGTGCASQMYCSYNSTKDSWKSCSYDTSPLTSSSFSWKSFACDSSSACTDDTTGTYTITRRPSEVKMHIGSHLQVYNGTGFFIGPERVVNFSDILEEELATCVADEQGYCNITLTFTSNTAGKLNLSNLKIYTQSNINVYNLTQLATNGLSVVLGFEIVNELSFDRTVNWTLNMGDANTLTSNFEIPLNVSEDAFIFEQYTYGGAGTYVVNATAFNETYSGSRLLNVTV
ncbi:MAG: hypothetical protein Q8L34_01435, partial [Candidatus Woesearchaeota archaeon]|nr:hypothetical protein [Candidatus Woesearchaeota archaeon]